MKPCTKMPNGHGSLYKEVRFSPTATPVRAQSVSTSNPASNPDYMRVVGASYIEHSRSLLERQRLNFENEREIFGEERRLWEQERSFLRLRIMELESLLKSRGEAGSSASNIHSLSPPLSSHHMSAPGSDSNPGSAHFHPQVWEGSSPALRPTRVFNDNSDNLSPGQIAPPMEQGDNTLSAPSLDAALSPRARATDPSGSSVPVPIEKLDSKLDGITLKSSALPPEIVARVMTPPSPSPVETASASASSSTSHRPAFEHKSHLRLKLSELGPPDQNLTKNAGHTPMAKFDPLDPATATDETTPGVSDEEKPFAPVATESYQPTENCDSYFPDPPDDPALTGPLSLLNEEEHDTSFLKELDQKLLSQAKHALSTTTAISEDGQDGCAEAPGQGEPEPELRFKNTTNFGTAFGLSNYGGI